MSAVKAVLLYSGGLDSLLAAKVLMDQGIDVTGLHCVLPFYPADINPEEFESSVIARQIGLKLIFYRCGKDYIDMIKNPAHGYGKNVNPCIDCKLFFMQKAAELMKELSADFVATGEVVGQRPMSQQKNTMIHIEKNSGLKGRLLRPLSAKLLEPTIPELEGKVDRNRLLNISGRGRKRQLDLAAFYGIENFSSPAGGCLFTDTFYASRVTDLFKHSAETGDEDLYLLKIGRHFRINDSLKIIISRNEPETVELDRMSRLSDYFIRPEFKGPSAFVKGVMTEEDLDLICSIILRYSKTAGRDNKLLVTSKDNSIKEITSSDPVDEEKLNLLRI